MMIDHTPPEAARESWRPVVGYEGLYEVSNHGRVRSVERDVALQHLYGGTVSHHRRGVVLSAKPKRNGCLMVYLSREGKNTGVSIAALVLEAFVGPRPPGWLAIPKDDDKSNCALTNLEWRSRGSVRSRTS